MKPVLFLRTAFILNIFCIHEKVFTLNQFIVPLLNKSNNFFKKIYNNYGV